MAEVASTSQQPSAAPIELDQRRRQPARLLMLAAAAVVVIAGTVGALAVFGNGSDSRADLIAAPDALTTTLDPTVDQFAGATVDVVWSSELDRAIVRASGLPDPGDGMAYELWFVTADGVAPAGLFTPTDGEADALLELDDVEGVGWGITIEPAAGSPAPTSEIIFSGLA